jgi:hypothetical protein
MMNCRSSFKGWHPNAITMTNPAKKMKTELPSLITPDTQSGLTLAGRLADRLHTQIEQSNPKEDWLGGMNYLPPKPVPKEIIASILFYAIAAANQGWTNKA